MTEIKNKNTKKSRFVKVLKIGFLLGIFLVIFGFATSILLRMSGTTKHMIRFSSDKVSSQSLNMADMGSTYDSFNEPKIMKEESVNYSKTKAPRAVTSSSQTTNESFVEEIDRKIIKNADISIIVKNIKDTRAVIENIIKKENGYISSSNFSKYQYGNVENRDRYQNAWYKIRVPSDKFEEIIKGFKGVAVKVTNENVTGRDVTTEYFDTETRIKIKRAEEEQYRKILLNAKEIKDVLQVTKELNRVVSEIEMQERKLKGLKSQVSMSTINLNLSEVKNVEVGGVIWTPVSDIRESFNSLLIHLRNVWSSVIYFLISVLPIWIINLFFIFVIFKVLKVVIKKFFPNISKWPRNIFEFTKKAIKKFLD